MTPNIVAFAPMPSASTSTHANANAGRTRNVRSENATSC